MSDLAFDALTTREAIRELQKIRAAEAVVESVVGPVMGMDSEYDVWAEALKRLNLETEGLQRSAAAAKAIFTIVGNKPARPRNVAMDAKAQASYEERFPNANRLGRSGW